MKIFKKLATKVLRSRAGSRVAVESAAMEWIGYDRRSRALFISFKGGGLYEYGCFPPSLWREFSAAQSKGRFFAKAIRGDYPYRKLAT